MQGELQATLERLTGARRTVTAAGRTDRGVHATGQVVAVDLPGWGDSGELDPALHVEDVSHAIAALVRSLGYDDWIVAGHSLGGVVALDLAARAPGPTAASAPRRVASTRRNSPEAPCTARTPSAVPPRVPPRTSPPARPSSRACTPPPPRGVTTRSSRRRQERRRRGFARGPPGGPPGSRPAIATTRSRRHPARRHPPRRPPPPSCREDPRRRLACRARRLLRARWR